MFTGLVEDLGVLRRRSGRRGGAYRVLVETSLGPLTLGESISVNGACLTVDRIVSSGFEADMSSETVDRTTLGVLPVGSALHLERATPLGGRMGGHVVLGHVDDIGHVLSLTRVGDTMHLRGRTAKRLARYLAPKGSIAVDGVSLTLNAVADDSDGVAFDVVLVPHTLRGTALGKLCTGARVNLEIDVLARYVARQLDCQSAERHPEPQGECDEPDQDRRFLAKLRAGGFA